METPNDHVWRVPIVKLNKQQVVVDLGGHIVDLVNLLDKITIHTGAEDNITFSRIKSNEYREGQFNNPTEAIGRLVSDKKAFCNIPITGAPRGGGRQTKARRRLSRRTRRTRR